MKYSTLYIVISLHDGAYFYNQSVTIFTDRT